MLPHKDIMPARGFAAPFRAMNHRRSYRRNGEEDIRAVRKGT